MRKETRAIGIWKLYVSYQVLGTPCFILDNKLKRLQLDLKRWNKEVFGNIEQRKKSLLGEIQSLDYLEEERPLVEEEKIRRAKAKVDLENVAVLQEVNWRQKSRVKEGIQHEVFSPSCRLSLEK
jgi:hypothetical protein